MAEIFVVRRGHSRKRTEIIIVRREDACIKHDVPGHTEKESVLEKDLAVGDTGMETMLRC